MVLRKLLRVNGCHLQHYNRFRWCIPMDLLWNKGNEIQYVNLCLLAQLQGRIKYTNASVSAFTCSGTGYHCSSPECVNESNNIDMVIIVPELMSNKVMHAVWMLRHTWQRQLVIALGRQRGPLFLQMLSEDMNSALALPAEVCIDGKTAVLCHWQRWATTWSFDLKYL